MAVLEAFGQDMAFAWEWVLDHVWYINLFFSKIGRAHV